MIAMDPSTHRRMRTAHANHTHTCVCGKTVRGNGGWASHRWACPVWQAAAEKRIAETGQIPSSVFNVRRAPRWVYDETSHRWIEAKREE